MNQIFRKTILLSFAALLSGLGGFLTACSISDPQTRSTSPDPSISSSATIAKAPEQVASDKMPHAGMSHATAMALGPADANYDLRFVDAMIPHHQGAVLMAKEVLQKSKRPELKKLAQAIITAQNQEIAQMTQWRKAWYPKVAAAPVAWHTQHNQMMPMSQTQSHAMMMTMNLGQADAQFDLRFINAMIPHHEGAIVMARDALGKSKRSEIQKLAQAIITSQQTEIDQMKAWRAAWYQQ
ncbi:MAG: DUF305 domain-containing protein [Scytolyngbya sp. HA4215-MV1]|jgi:uncharacterized protein (DUF305 family)|nr:DUF305 domain-containing protein [Scytolyngbya sp. HA4215-MV1]